MSRQSTLTIVQYGSHITLIYCNTKITSHKTTRWKLAHSTAKRAESYFAMYIQNQWAS